MQSAAIDTNPQECTGCRTCEVVCSLWHERSCDPARSRITVTADYEQSLFEPHICQLCDSPECVAACQMEALSQDAQTKVIIIDSKLCNGCQTCVEACPYGSIRWSSESERVFVCDRCGGKPTCVQFCTSGALRLVGAG